MNKKALALSSALLANVIWGFISIAFRFLKEYPAEQILYYRIFVSFVICWLYILIVNSKKLSADVKEIASTNGKDAYKLYGLILLSGVFITLNWFTFIYVVNNVNLKSAAFAYMVCPLITALGGFVILKEELSRFKIIGIALAIVSIFILATGSFMDVMWSVTTAAFYAFFLIIQRIIQNISKINMLGFQLVIALGLVLPLFFIFPQPIPNDINFWIDILIISVVFTIIPLLLSLYALSVLPSSTVGILIYINPVVAFSIAFFYFNEGIKANQVLAYGLLVFAVIIFNLKIIKDSFFKLNQKRMLKQI
ncbi:EamA family transporter [Pedobacter alpinus]|uniref:EamA family transporter n=1 Tax=Pedobacter alpinus TaxID=1590643 RepID=A0ABW5TLM6_9SPHI